MLIYYFMSIYLTTIEIKLRISQIEKRLGELSTMKEKIAFKSFKSESYVVVSDYINSYGSDAENQYNINRRLAIADLDVKVKRYDAELSELRTILEERKRSEMADADAIHRAIRHREIERIKLAEREMERPMVHLIPAFSPSGIGGFIPAYHPGIGVHMPFAPSPTSVFVSPAHVIGRKSTRS